MIKKRENAFVAAIHAGIFVAKDTSAKIQISQYCIIGLKGILQLEKWNRYVNAWQNLVSSIDGIVESYDVTSHFRVRH